MEAMTYRELKEYLNKFTEEDLDCNVTVMAENGEFYPLHNSVLFTMESEDDTPFENDNGDLMLDPSDGILDSGHPWLAIQDCHPWLSFHDEPEED